MVEFYGHFYKKMVKNVKILAKSSQFWPLGVPKGFGQNYFSINIPQLFQIYLFCDITFIVSQLLWHLKPKMPKNGFLKPWGSRKRGSGDGGSKIFGGQQHNHKKKMCENFFGFSLETFGDKQIFIL